MSLEAQLKAVWGRVSQGLEAKGIDPTTLHPDSGWLIRAFAISRGQTEVLGEQLYLDGLMPRVPRMLEDPKIVGDLVEVWDIIHPGMPDKLNKRFRVEKADHVVTVVKAGCINYFSALRTNRNGFRKAHPNIDIDARIEEVGRLIEPFL